MQKFRHKNGGILLCGWLPPANASVSGSICVLPGLAAYTLTVARRVLAFAQILPAGVSCVPLPTAFALFAVCVCAGISLSRSVTDCSPALSPRSLSESPGPWPGCMGAFPWRLGRPNVDFPSPPYVVPRSEKRAVFWLIGNNWPSQSAQPLGAKLKPKILISATNGFDIDFLL